LIESCGLGQLGAFNKFSCLLPRVFLSGVFLVANNDFDSCFLFLSSIFTLASNGISESMEGFGTPWNMLEHFGTSWYFLEHLGTGEFESQSPEVCQPCFPINQNGAAHHQRKSGSHLSGVISPL